MSSALPHAPSPILTCGALAGDVVRLEPLAPGHVPALREAAAGAGPSAFAAVPAPEEVEAYVAGSIARREAGSYAPFAQVETATGRVVGHTAYLTPRWMPDGRLFAVEVGSSWLSPAVRGTAVNPASKLLLLTRAFEDWDVDRLDIKTDARNDVAHQRARGQGGRGARNGCCRGHGEDPRTDRAGASGASRHVLPCGSASDRAIIDAACARKKTDKRVE